MPEETINISVRMPKPLHNLLVTSAKQNMRSINSEILWCIANQLVHGLAQSLERGKK